MARPSSSVDGVRVSGPLAAFVDAYAAELAALGYRPLSVVGELRQVGRLSGWLDAQGFSAADLGCGLVEGFLAWQRAAGRSRSQWSRPGLLVLLDVLRGLGVVAAEPVAEPSASELLVASFAGYLRSERGLAEGTIRGYVRHARVLLDSLGERGLAGVAAGDVTGALIGRAAAGWSVSATRFFVSGLRAFLRFCFAEGLVAVDLSPAALYASGRAPSPLPKAITQGQARALLGSCDRRGALGRRDYALILLLLRLGLRCGEVARLRLADIDWRAGEIVVQGKASRIDRLPLPVDVGEAIAGYLQRGRPASPRRELFLRANAPFSPIAAKTVSSTVRRACQRAELPVVGAHHLRHTAACEMVTAGVALTGVGQVLRHRSLQTTAIYARVDLEQLRRLAVPWPGSDPS
ncbi:MAG: tyrosine-type recombinase/integrase [Solirubrobacteraceae bacterium]